MALLTQVLRRGGDRLSRTPGGRRLTPYLLLGPGMLWLVLFFAVPVLTLFATSLQVPVPGGEIGEFRQGFRFANYLDVVQEYWVQFLQSFGYAATATLAALVIGYPLAYYIAQRAGRWRNLLLVLIVAPFFAGASGSRP